MRRPAIDNSTVEKRSFNIDKPTFALAIGIVMTTIILVRIELETYAAARTEELRKQNNPCWCAQ